MWPDGDFAFDVSHYFGQAVIKVQLYTTGVFGSSYCIGEASLTLGEVVAAHQTRLAQLASPPPELTDSALGIHTGWLQPGDDPLIHRVTLPLRQQSGKPAKGTVTFSMAFMGGALENALGPLQLNRLHRAAAGGMSDLLRLMMRKGHMGVRDMFVAARSGMTPADYAAQGNTVGHFQCLLLLTYLLRNTSCPTLCKRT